MTWAARLASLSDGKSPYSGSSNSSDSPILPPIGPNGAIGVGVFSAKRAANDQPITVPCSRCGTLSRPFMGVINPDLWQCDTCLPADPIDQAYEAIERQAIIAEGRPAETVLIATPVSWADASLIPTPGARCRCCSGSVWWTEPTSPKGWRCATCYPADHLPADAVRRVAT